MPLVVDVVAQKISNSKHRYLIALGTSVVIGALLNINLFFPFDITALLANLGVVITASQAAYKLYWEESEPRKTLQLDPKDL